MRAAELAAWASALGLGAVVSAAVRWLVTRQHASAEVESITVSTATEVVNLVKEQLLELRREVRALEEEVSTLKLQVGVLSSELHARGANPAQVLARLHRDRGD